MRFKLFLSVCVILVFTFLFSCRPGTNTRRRVLIYTSHGQDLLKDFIARYKQRYPDADVQFLDMGSREILERVR
jgi:iron(III) transport system substrate-binding protein